MHKRGSLLSRAEQDPKEAYISPLCVHSLPHTKTPTPYLCTPLLPHDSTICVVHSQDSAPGLCAIWHFSSTVAGTQPSTCLRILLFSPEALPSSPRFPHFFKILLPSNGWVFLALLPTSYPLPPCSKEREMCRNCGTRVLFSLKGQEGMSILVSASFDTAVTDSFIHTPVFPSLHAMCFVVLGSSVPVLYSVWFTHTSLYQYLSVHFV